MTHLLELCDRLGQQLKHLPGKHDQTTHGRRTASSGAGAITDPSHAATKLSFRFLEE